MPCADCGHILIYETKRDVLYCPTCHRIPVIDEDQGKEVARNIQDNYLNHRNLVELLEEFEGYRVITELLHQLNGGANGMANENRMQFKQFFTATPVIKSVYTNWDKFDHHIRHDSENNQSKVRSDVETILKGAAAVIPILKHIQERFALVQELTPVQTDWRGFYRNNDFLKTEYWLCSERCKRATVGAREEIRDQFLEQQELFRGFNKTDTDDIETVKDFGDAWYGLIVSLGFSATLDESLQGAFTTDFPDFVTILDIEEFIEKVDYAVRNQLTSRGEGDFRSLSLDESTFDKCGNQVFGKDWPNVKSTILVSPSNPNAHPMFFKYSGTRDRMLPGWRKPRSSSFSQIIYPDLYTLLLKLQIYPLLENGEYSASKDILAELTASRGLEFERHIFEYLRDQGLEAYHSCKTAKQNGNEVDVIFIRNGTLYFVEAKFVLPTLNMNTQRGIQAVNDTFDEKIFRDGESFDSKVKNWLDLPNGHEFTHQEERSGDGRMSRGIPDEWSEMETKMLVVSNFVPSYFKKRGVRFLTDLELHQWISYETDVFRQVLSPPRHY